VGKTDKNGDVDEAIRAGFSNKPVGGPTMPCQRLASEQQQVADGGSVGAMRRMEYQGAPYHRAVDNPLKSKRPVHGQDALDLSVQVKPTSPRRIGIDYKTGDFVVFDRTVNNIYHGHVRSWNQLEPGMKKALQEAGMVDRRGNIIRR
jgi:filamentous hemagglutinin